ncbi:hypothetical protein WKV44_00640 [Spirochaetia bacterium 38H-sp]|uniref:Uncharacterized protein n=1 Tax=Rarispira pelagica TaxID=3141764 RepID=A0ABU9U8P6_9SPIR
MEDINSNIEKEQEFGELLEKALTEKTHEINQNILPVLKEKIRSFHTAYSTIYQNLIKKGVIQQDPYHYEEQMADINIPDTSPFSESERISQMSIRLSAYDNQLDFLTTYYQFSLDFITIERIQKIAQLINYFNWQNISPRAEQINTRSIAIIIDKVKLGSDSMAAKLISSSVQTLEKLQKEIMSILREILSFQKEAYKFRIRQIILMTDKLEKNISEDKFIEHIKKNMKKLPEGSPFYKELILQIYQEDYGKESKQLRQDILNKIGIKKEKKHKEDKRTEEMLFILQDSLTAITTVSSSLDAAAKKLSANINLYKGRKKSAWQKLIEWLSGLSGNKKGPIFDLDYVDITTGKRMQESIDMIMFLNNIKILSNKLDAYHKKLFTYGIKLIKDKEEESLDNISKLLEKLGIISRRLQSTETYLKSELNKIEREKILTFKEEINKIRAAIQLANQKRHEYIARKEEIEQLKKLGIEE